METRFFQDADAWEAFRLWYRASGLGEVFVLTDSHTHQHCLPVFMKHWNGPLRTLTVEAGEENKHIGSAIRLWQDLLALGAHRGSLLIALGGGMITDLGGFVASTFQRGMPFVLMPTSLLGQVDAAIGGKTGVDLGASKNMVGSFASPAAILWEPAFLETLPLAERRSGMAEMFKHGLIRDVALFEALAQQPVDGLPEAAFIRQAVAIKRAVVESDPFERGVRQVLNFGHSIGHALESVALAKGRPVPHGIAVAAGMRLETRLSVSFAGLAETEAERIIRVLDRFFPDFPDALWEEEHLLAYLRQDKKNREGQLRMALLTEPGRAVWDIAVPESAVRTLLATAAGSRRS